MSQGTIALIESEQFPYPNHYAVKASRASLVQMVAEGSVLGSSRVLQVH